MKTPLQYMEHVGIMAEYYGTLSVGQTDPEAAQGFESVYEDALEVGYGEAKAYLSALDEDTLGIIRDFHHLADDIDVASLSEEGAYNLLVHRYEQLDLNGDGLIRSGAADLIPLLPQEMPNDLKRGIVETVGQMQEEGFDYFRDISPIMMRLHFTFNTNVLNTHLKEMTGRDDIRVSMPDFTFRALQEMQERLHHPTGGMTVDKKTVENFDRFMEILGGVLGETATAGTDATGSEEDDAQIASFFDRVRAAGGALSFIQQLNLEKIEKLIEEKRKELEEKMGLNAEPPLPDNVRAQVIKELEALLEEYKKDLLEDMKKRSGSQDFDRDAYLRVLINETAGTGEKPVELAAEPAAEDNEKKTVNS